MDLIKLLFLGTCFFLFSWNQLCIIVLGTILFKYSSNYKTNLSKKFSIFNIILLIYYLIIQSIIIYMRMIVLKIKGTFPIIDRFNHHYSKKLNNIFDYLLKHMKHSRKMC